MNIPEILDIYGIDRDPQSNRHTRDGWCTLNCPFCQSGKYHLGYSLNDDFFYCWNCGYHSVKSVLYTLIGNDAHNYIKSYDKNATTKTTEDVSKLELPQYGKLLDSHKKYLRKRGYNSDELEKLWDIGGIGFSYPYKWCIYIPVKENGVVVSWQLRTIEKNNKLRYINPEKNKELKHIKELLYGFDNVQTNTVVVCEGVFDVWRIGYGAVCTFGIGYTYSQINKLINFAGTVIIAFDNEVQAQRRADTLANKLVLCGKKEVYNYVVDGNDIDTASKRDVSYLRKCIAGII